MLERAVLEVPVDALELVEMANLGLRAEACHSSRSTNHIEAAEGD